jgi:hypothetical protein
MVALIEPLPVIVRIKLAKQQQQAVLLLSRSINQIKRNDMSQADIAQLTGAILGATIAVGISFARKYFAED